MTHRTPSARQASARRVAGAGFTLIELMVVVGIIVLLVGLTITVTAAVTRKSEMRQTENMLRLLDLAVTEWEHAADRQISWGTADVPPNARYDIDETTGPENQMRQLLARIGTTSEVRDVLAQVNPDLLTLDEATGTQRLTDAWDQPVYLVHPGRVANPYPPFNDVLADADPDGTIRTEPENMHGIAESRRMLFVSAGPDGKFGNLDTNSPEYDPDPAADNVYSYPPGIEP